MSAIRRSPRPILRAGMAGIAALLLAACWPMPGASPNRRSHNAIEDDITAETVSSLSEAWTVEVGQQRVMTPVWSTAGIHAVGHTPDPDPSDFDPTVVVQTVRPGTGEVRWEQSVGGGLSTGSNPVVVGDEVYVGWGQGNLGGRYELAGFDVDTGARGPDRTGALVDTARDRRLGLYSLGFGSGGPCANSIGIDDLDDPESSWTGTTYGGELDCKPVPPTLGADALYLGGQGPLSRDFQPALGNGIRAYTITEPEACFDSIYVPCPTWATPLPGTTATPPVIGDGGATLYTATDLGTLYAVDAADGTILWSAPLGATVTDPPALAYGSLFVPTGAGLQVLPADGCGATECVPTWTADAGNLGTQPAVAGGVVFTGAQNGDVNAFPADGCGSTTCTSVWSTTTGSGITGGPVVTQGQLYVGTNDGRLIAYAPAE